jgi:serine/threonine protein kinase
MSTLRHPKMVQFLGLCTLPDSPMPVILMDRLLMSLLESCRPNPMSLILHNVASGLAFLHEQSSPIIHSDLTASNVLLNSGMVAKIADLGTARILPSGMIAATMTRAPGNLVYMPPEAFSHKIGERERDQRQAQYDTGIDIFSFGVVSLFTLTQTFPCDLLPSTYVSEGGELKARTELERREAYIRQLPRNHLFLQLVEGCLDHMLD